MCKEHAQKEMEILMKTQNHVSHIILTSLLRCRLLTAGILLTVIGAILAALLPPLVLEKIINLLTDGEPAAFSLALLYFALLALTGVLESCRESLLTIAGQRMTHALRSAMCHKLSQLPADTFVRQEPGVVVSRFVGDVDTIEDLFTSGIISMAADLCKIISILVIVFIKNKGLALLLLFLLPLVYVFTRVVQKRMLKAQLENRRAVGKVTNHVPETIRCIRTIHTLGKEKYMEEKYDSYIEESYHAMEKTNFYDSIYSPVIQILNAGVVAVVVLLSATGNLTIRSFFGMTVGTSVAVISYISQVFTPLESIGMEIQTIQSAIAGVHRIHEFLDQPQRWDTDTQIASDSLTTHTGPCIEVQHVSFSYDGELEILHDLQFEITEGEQVTLIGRTGAGKSTVFKLLLGLYRPQKGQLLIYGQDAALLPDRIKRHIFGYVEQTFRMVPGTIADQITLFDASIREDRVKEAAQTVGLHDAIMRLPDGYNTPCQSSLFSQGQWQLLSIARAIAAKPQILLLDEITANLDASTEQSVLTALKKAAQNRTVLSISHRLYEQTGGRTITI